VTDVHPAVDVLVVGAGLAGLHTATLLARRGHEVLLVERRPTLTGTIRTTGIFVRKTLDDFPLPPDCLGPAIRRVVLYPPDLRRPVALVSDRDEFRVGDMAPLYVAAARAAADAGVRIALGTRYAGRGLRTVYLHGPDGPSRVRARFLVGADGARSRVAGDLALDRNRALLIGAEEVFEVPRGEQPPTFHCVLDPSLAPGYLAWVVHDGRHAHVGVAGYADRFPQGMRRALARFGATAPGLDGVGRLDEVERRGGPIPVGGLLRRISSPDGLLVGDAAGAVSPLTAGGLDPCLRLSELAADVLDDALRSGRPDALASYDGAALRAHFRGRLLLRRGLAQVRTPTVAAAAFTVLRTPFGQAAARRILFGDRSFPAAARSAA
jgi:flavin-dependent dehydrogenase